MSGGPPRGIPLQVRTLAQVEAVEAECRLHYHLAAVNGRLDEVPADVDAQGLEDERRGMLERLPVAKRILHARAIPFEIDGDRLLPWRGNAYAPVVVRDPRAVIPILVEPDPADTRREVWAAAWWRDHLLLYAARRRYEQALRAVRALLATL